MPAFPAELVGEQLRMPEVSFTVIEGDIRRLIFKPNDVRTSIACDVSHKPRMFFNPPALFISKVAGDELRFFKGAVSSVLRYVDAVLAESHDIPESITIDVYDNAEMFLDAPLFVSKIFEHKLRWFYGAMPLVDRDIDTLVTEADNINTLFACHVGEGPNMLIDAPTAREGELVQTWNIVGIFECPIAVVFRNNDASLSKSNDVGETLSVEVGQKAEMLVEPPALSITEVIENNGGRSESGASRGRVVLGQEDACVTKSNDISATSLPDIGHVTDVFINAPTCVVCEISKHVHESIESVFVAVPSSDADIYVGKRDEIIETVASGICKEADMFIVRIGGTRGSVRDGGKGREFIAAEAPDRDTTIGLETDDIGAT
jgi:hypothetical protein